VKQKDEEVQLADTILRFTPSQGGSKNDIVSTEFVGGEAVSFFTPARPLPETDYWFETVWHEYNVRKKRTQN